jgi:hypothetical protein
MKIEVSNAEIIDKLTIVAIKLGKIIEPAKKEHLFKEYSILSDAGSTILALDHPLYQELLKINQKLWDIEDEIRELEREKDFGERFIDLARNVYFTNDERSRVKNEINRITNSSLTEVKSYKPY